MRKLSGLLLSLVTVVATLGLMELMAVVWEGRTAQGPDGWTLVGSRRLELVRHGDRDHPYYLFEPGRTYRWEGIEVNINSYGIRGPEFATRKDPTTFRILNLGDSIPFGWEVEYEATYGQVLRHSAEGHFGPGQAEVITVGIPGWTPGMARNYLVEQGHELDPDLVILAITVVNDVYGEGPHVDDGGGLISWLRDSTYSWPVLTTETRRLLANMVDPRFMPVLNPPRTAASYFPLDRNDPKWEELGASIVEVREWCEEQGAPLIVLVFPTAMQINEEAHPPLPQTLLAEWAAESGFLIVDLLPTYRQECERVGSDQCQGLKNHLFADVWMHPNARGHELAAQSLAPLVNEALAANQ